MKTRLLIYPFLALGAFLMTGLTLLAQTPDSPRITALLQQAKEHAARASLDAEQIESFTRSKTSWVSHSAQLSHMKDDVNALGEVTAELTSARDEASAWQREAIDDINPLLSSMADHLNAMITHLGEHPNKVHLPAYTDYAKANYQFSQRMLTMISDYMDYAEAKTRTEALEQKLELPAEPDAGNQ